MNASAPMAAPTAPAPSAEEVARSLRRPLRLMLGGAAFWLFSGSLGLLLCNLKLHLPGFLSAWWVLAYGRLKPAATHQLLYGFASQAGLAAALWILCRQGQSRLRGPAAACLGTLLWNLGVVLGTLGILGGQSTGFEWLEMPAYASPMLCLAYLVLAACAVATFAAGTGRPLYLSQAYILAALIWFPAAFGVAQVLLVLSPVRGVVQTAVNQWFISCLLNLWLTPLGLAAVFYFTPKILQRPLPSRSLAWLGFWSLALLGGWTGSSPSAPLPSWMEAVRTAANLLLLVPIVAVGINWNLLLAGEPQEAAQDEITPAPEPARDPRGRRRASPRAERPPRAGLLDRFLDARRIPGLNGEASQELHLGSPLGLLVVGMVAYLLAALMGVIGSLRPLAVVTEFTLYGSARFQLFIFGFLAFTLAGAARFIWLELNLGTGVDSPLAPERGCPHPQQPTGSTRADQAHAHDPHGKLRVRIPTLQGWRGRPPFVFLNPSWVGAAGVVIATLALSFGGVLQGRAWNDAEVSLSEMGRSLQPFLWAGSMGLSLVVLAAGWLLADVLSSLLREAFTGWRQWRAWVSAPPDDLSDRVSTPPSHAAIPPVTTALSSPAPTPPTVRPTPPPRSHLASAGIQNHGWPIMLGAFLTLALSWAGLVLAPQRQLGRQQAELSVATETLYPTPRSGEAQQGLAVYTANGCAHCHTLQVRPRGLGADFERGWGQRRSVARDYLYDEPVQTGFWRVGPDLANLSLRLTNRLELLRFLYAPSLVRSNSLMPPHPFLFETRRIFRYRSPDALELSGPLAPPAGFEIVPTEPAHRLVAFLLSLQADTPLFEAPLAPTTKPPGAPRP